MYRVRLDELDKIGLFETAVQVARYFLENGKDRVSYIDMKTIIRQAHIGLGMDAGDSSVAETRIGLVSTGFIWKTNPAGSMSAWYEPGIPSLMNHVVNESRKVDEGFTKKLLSRPQAPPRGAHEQGFPC